MPDDLFKATFEFLTMYVCYKHYRRIHFFFRFGKNFRNPHFSKYLCSLFSGGGSTSNVLNKIRVGEKKESTSNVRNADAWSYVFVATIKVRSQDPVSLI